MFPKYSFLKEFTVNMLCQSGNKVSTVVNDYCPKYAE